MLVTRAYYRCKPFVPRAMRLALRRARSRRLLQSSADTWPIRPSAGRRPAQWPGWPDDKRFAVVLTHDVESKRGLDRVRQVAELERKAGFRSAFNFVPEGCYRVSPELREWLVGNGFEVGVHDLHHDGRLYNSRKSFSAKAERINDYLKEWEAVGFRSGFMLRRLDWLHELDVLYDASTFDTDPFEPQPEGVGTIFPYWIAGPSREKASCNGYDTQCLEFTGAPAAAGGYVELPYTMPQDSTLFIVLEEKTPEIWWRKLDWIVEQGGMVLMNVHPDYINFESDAPDGLSYPAAFYTEFLDRLSTRYANQFWAPLPKELARWYRNEREKVLTLDETKKVNGNPISRGPRLVTAPRRDGGLSGKRVAVVLLSDYANDPRPRRAAEALVSEGMEVDVICVRRSEDEATREILHGVNVLRLPIKHRRGGKFAYAALYGSFLAACFGILSARSFRRRYDIVHVHNMPDILVFSALVPRLRGAKVVLDLHDPMPELMRTIFGLPEESRGVRFLKQVEKTSIGYSDAVITVNETCRKLFAARSCAPEKVAVVMNTPDESLFSFRPPVKPETSRSAKPFVVMYHGSLVERNGLALAVEAVAEVRRRLPHVELWIYGHRTPFLEEVLAGARARGVSEGIHYCGSKTIEEIVDAIDACDLGVIPNLKNIFTEINTPTRIFEFLSRGKPVVAPSAPGILEYFAEDDLVSFQLGDAQDLADKIEFIVRNPDRVFEITRRGQQVCKAHRWCEERGRLVNLIGDLLSVNSAGSPPETRRGHPGEPVTRGAEKPVSVFR